MSLNIKFIALNRITGSYNFVGEFTNLWWLKESFCIPNACIHAEITKYMIERWLKESESNYHKEKQYTEVRDFLQKQLDEFNWNIQQMFIHAALG